MFLVEPALGRIDGRNRIGSAHKRVTTSRASQGRLGHTAQVPAGHADNGTSAAVLPTTTERSARLQRPCTIRGHTPDRWQSCKRSCTSTLVTIWPLSQTDWWCSSELQNTFAAYLLITPTQQCHEQTTLDADGSAVNPSRAKQHRWRSTQRAETQRRKRQTREVKLKVKKRGNEKSKAKHETSPKFEGCCGQGGK